MQSLCTGPPPPLLCGSSSFLWSSSAPANLLKHSWKDRNCFAFAYYFLQKLHQLRAFQRRPWSFVTIAESSCEPISLLPDMQKVCWHMLTLRTQPCDKANRWQEHSDSRGPTGHKICFHSSSPSFCTHSPSLLNWKTVRVCGTYLQVADTHTVPQCFYFTLSHH